MPRKPEPDPGCALPTDDHPLVYRELVDSHSSVLRVDTTTHPTNDIDIDKTELRDLASLTKRAIMEAIQCLECNQSESSTDTEDDSEGGNTNSTNFESEFLLNEPDPGQMSRSTESSSELSTPITQEISPLITPPPKQTARMVYSDNLNDLQVTSTTEEEGDTSVVSP